MKCDNGCFDDTVISRSPYGERGLKYVDNWLGVPRGLSLSLRRAWIEIVVAYLVSGVYDVALLTESVD